MDTLRRAFRRSGINVAYSQGYNPHIKLSPGQPLPVGMVGLTEYFDLELNEPVKGDVFRSLVNQSLPDGLIISEAKAIPENVKSLQAVVDTAIYLFHMKFKEKIEQEKVLREFLQRQQIIITRTRRKKKNRKIDLRQLIYEAEILKDSRWRFQVSTGSRGNVRPSEIIKALSLHEKNICEVPVVNIIREGMLVSIGDNLFKPFADEVVRR